MTWRHDGDAVLLAVFLAVIPLVPGAATALNWNGMKAFDVLVLAMVIAFAILRHVTRRPVAIHPHAEPAVTAAILFYIVALSGAALIGLAADNRFGSAVFALHVGDLVGPNPRNVDLAIDPFYPFRVWLTSVEGVVVLVLVWRWCLLRGNAWNRAMTAALGWTAGLIVVSVLAIAQYLTRYHLHPLWVARNPSLVRAHSTLDDPNMLGSYLVLSVGIACAVALAATRRATIRMALVAATLACIAIVTTVSRAALGGLVLAVLLAGAVAPRGAIAQIFGRRTLVRAVSRALLAAAVALIAGELVLRAMVVTRPAITPSSPLQVVAQTLDPRVPYDSALKGRAVYWNAAWRAVVDHPLEGVGLGRYPRMLPQYRSRWVPLDNAHNFYLQVLAEGGVLTLSAFAAVIAACVLAAWRTARGEGPAAGFGFGALVGISGFALTMMSGQPLANQSGQLLWGAALGLTLGASAATRHGQPSRSAGRRGVPVLLAGVALAFIVAIARTPSPPVVSDPWGYNWGLFPEEFGYFPRNARLPREAADVAPGPAGTQVAPFRWSGADAVIEMRPAAGATECIVPFAALLPSYGRPQQIRFSNGSRTETIDVTTSDLSTYRIGLRPQPLDAAAPVALRVSVSPSFVPAELGLSPDSRRLGIQIFPVNCS